MDDPQTLEASIRAFLGDELHIEVELGRDTELVTTGLIDSAGLVRLAALIERTLAITIPDRDINAEHFEDVESILAYVRLRLEA